MKHFFNITFSVSITVLLMTWVLNGQPKQHMDAFSSGGEQSQEGNMVAHWTIGEPVCTKLVTEQGVLSQGFQQGEDMMETMMGADMGPMVYPDNFSLGEEVRYYPNPAKDVLAIEVPKEGAARVLVYDMGGNMLGEWDFDEKSRTTKINVSQLIEGVYQVRILNVNGDPMHKFRFIKR